MSTPSLFITATDLKQWADTRDAQGDVPRLVRRLIHATVGRVLRRSMPAGDSVQSGGWDGTVIVEGGNEFVPEGVSAWEFSAAKDHSGKAQENYEKRTANPRGLDPQTSTFIFVTPRIWQGKTEWANARKLEGIWLDVRAYDGDDLERWLELASAVQFWLAQHLHKLPEAATDVETFWRDWSEATKPSLTPELVLAGRERFTTTIHGWLRGSDASLAARAETPQEAIAAFGAAILILPEEERLTWLARTAVVENAAAWVRLAVAPKGLMLIPLFEVGDLFARATRGGHRVFVPLGRAENTADDLPSVGSLDEKSAAKELEHLEVMPGRALELAMIARRSMMAFRRAIAIRPELQQPAWANPAVARTLLPALLAGAWEEGHLGDRQTIASIAGSSYESVQATMLRWANESEPPVRQIDQTWYLAAPEDAWNLLLRYLTRDDLERFETVAVDLLGTPDPRFDLPPTDWSAARALDAKPLQSELLRRHVAEAGAMLATRGNRTSAGTGITAADFAGRIVAKVLAKAQEDWRVWASLSDIKALPPLAEAAPDIFLSAVERSAGGDDPTLRPLFTDKDDAFFSRTQHIGLLDALEALAWSERYFGRASRVVAALARIDPGGRHGKRPSVSLLHFFWPERPSTMAQAEARLTALDAILAREPEIGWKMLIDLFPHHFGRHALFGTHPPQWLEVHPDRYRRPNREEVETQLHAFGDRVVAGLIAVPHRTLDVIAILDRLANRTREEVLSQIESLATGTALSYAERVAIWTALREYMRPYKLHGEDFPQELAHIEALYGSFEPEGDADRIVFLFDARPPLEQFEGSTDEQLRALRVKQKAALATLASRGGVDAVLALISRVGRPESLGLVGGELAFEDDVAMTTAGDVLSSPDPVTLQFGRGFTSALIRMGGTGWAEVQLAARSDWPAISRAEVLMLFPDYRHAWQLLDSESEEVRRLYWQRLESWTLPPNEIEAVAAGLLNAGRPFTLIDYLAEQVRNTGAPDAALILSLLEQAMKTAESEDKPSSSFFYNLADLLGALADSATGEEESRVALLEWEVLPILIQQERTPKMLHREIARNPKLFAKMVRAAHPRKRDGARLSEDEQRDIFNLHRFLASLVIPADDHLTSWVAKAREALAADDLAKQGEIYIGMALSKAPGDEDGTWPPRVVRDVIENTPDDEVQQGFVVGVLNERGMTWRGEYEGGTQERDLVAKYEAHASAIDAGWGRTAAMLRQVARSYSSEARREDASANLWRDLGS